MIEWALLKVTCAKIIKGCYNHMPPVTSNNGGNLPDHNSREVGISDDTTPVFLPHRSDLYDYLKNGVIEPF